MGPEAEKCEVPSVPDLHRAWCLDQIIEKAAGRHGVSSLEIKSTARDRAVVAARVEVWKYLRTLGWSYPRIGKAFGRDHTSVFKTLLKHYGRTP